MTDLFRVDCRQPPFSAPCSWTDSWGGAEAWRGVLHLKNLERCGYGGGIYLADTTLERLSEVGFLDGREDPRLSRQVLK